MTVTVPEARDEYEREEIGEKATHKWDQPLQLVGTYLGAVERNGQFGVRKLHAVQLLTGARATFFAPTQLDWKLAEVRSGETMEITYGGETVPSKNGGNPVKVFTVNRLRPKGQPAAAVTPAADAVEEDVPF